MKKYFPEMTTWIWTIKNVWGNLSFDRKLDITYRLIMYLLLLGGMAYGICLYFFTENPQAGVNTYLFFGMVAHTFTSEWDRKKLKT